MPRVRKSGDGGLYFDKARSLWIGTYPNGYTASGRPKQARVTSKSQAVAIKKLAALKHEIDNHGSPLGNQTVAEWGAFWLDGYKYKKPQTYRTYTSLLKTWVTPAVGRKKVKDVRPSDLRGIYNNIRSAGRSTSTAVKVHNMLSGMFEEARLERLVSTNVVKDIKTPVAARAERDTFTPAETLAILEAASVARHGSKWIASLYAGLRQGERIGATLDSVNFLTGRMTVAWNLVEGNYEHGCGGTCGKKAAGHCPHKRLLIPEGIDVRLLKGRLMLVPPKSGEPRTIPMPQPIMDMIEEHVTELASAPNPHALLWPAADGSPMTARNDQAEWKALLVAAGVDRPTATTHWARHTAISDLTASGISDRIIGEIVGHRSPGVTGRYQHVSSKDAEEAMRRLGERRQLES